MAPFHDASSATMTTIQRTLAQDHRQCDAQFAAAEEAVADGAWGTARNAFVAFRAAVEHHFAMEEGVLFPEFEARSGSAQGPTQVMRTEHVHLRELLARMAAALDAGDTEGYLGASETLLMFMQQHNLKEEQMLYPMCDQVLGPEAAGLIARMQAVGAG